MNITCNSCSKNISIPDEKIPKGKAFSVSCPECKNKISVPIEPDSQQEKQAPVRTKETEEIDTDSLPSFNLSTFDFQEESKLSALICDPEKELFKEAITAMGYSCEINSSHEEAINKLRFTTFDIIVVNESFAGCTIESNPLLGYLQPLQMSERRRIFVILVSEKMRTLDNMAAFVHSVNLVINKNDLEQVGAIIKKGLIENGKFFKVIRKALKDIKGREE